MSELKLEKSKASTHEANASVEAHLLRAETETRKCSK